MPIKPRRFLLFTLALIISLVLLLIFQNQNLLINNILIHKPISPQIVYNPTLNIPKEHISPNEYYAWIPHFDFANGLSSAVRYKDKIKEVHFAGASVNEEGNISYSANFDSSLSSLNNNGIKFGINIISTNSNNTKKFLDKGHMNIVNLTKDLKTKYSFFNSLNLNLESLDQKDDSLFLNFINSVNVELDKYNINLFVSVFAPSVKANKLMLTLDALADINLLIKSCDKLVLLFYDYGINGNGIGNSPLPWLENTISGISPDLRDKTIIGLPLYGYEFNAQNQVLKSYTYTQIQRLSGISNIQVDITSDEPYFVNSVNKVYFMDKSTLNNRKNIATQYGINSFFFWRLGGDNGIWMD